MSENNNYVKVSPLQAMKTQGVEDPSVHILAATAPRRGRVVNNILGRFYPRRLSRSQDQYGREEVRKILHLSLNRD